MPQDGYTALFEHMLDHDLIDVFCDVDARDLFEIDETTVKIDGKVYGGEIVYTGPLDELFNLDLGALPYRTLDMKFETLDMDQFQPVGTVNYTTSEDLHAHHRVQEHDGPGPARQDHHHEGILQGLYARSARRRTTPFLSPRTVSSMSAILSASRT